MLRAIACGCILNHNAQPENHRAHTAPCEGLVLLLLNSGFRISDAVRLQRSSVDHNTGRMLIRVMKTNVPLYGRLPAAAQEALRALPTESPYKEIL